MRFLIIYTPIKLQFYIYTPIRQSTSTSTYVLRNQKPYISQIRSYHSGLKLVNKDGQEFSLTPTFIEWLTGFADAESNFHISLKYREGNEFKSYQLTFQIGLHIDDLNALQSIQHSLKCGGISVSGKKCNYYVNDFYSLFYIILPIFDSFKLNSAKIHTYLIWREAVILIHRCEHFTPEGRQKLVTLRDKITKFLEEPQPNTKFQITSNWLLGFIEGDSCFSTIDLIPRLRFENHTVDTNLLQAIKSFLGEGVISTPKPRLGPTTVLEILNCRYLFFGDQDYSNIKWT